jgi:hypothetical protein
MKVLRYSMAIITTSLALSGLASTAHSEEHVAKLTETTYATVRATLASKVSYERATSGYQWGASPDRTSEASRDMSNLAWSESVSREAVPFSAAAKHSFSNDKVADETGYLWGIRSTASQAGYLWGIRSTADQAGYLWGIRSTADQAGYLWGIRSTADQTGYLWGIRSTADQAGYLWGIH